MDFGDYPQQNKPIPWKMIAIIGGGVLVAIMLIVIVLRMIGPKNTLLVSETKQEGVVNCDQAADPETCKQMAQKKLATETKDPDACKDLTDANKEDCLLGVAAAKADVGLCEKLKDDSTKTLCLTSVYKTLAIQKTDVKLCDKIPNEGVKKACQDEILGPVTVENCAARGQSKEYCQMLVVAKAARDAQDPQMCQGFGDDLRGVCLQFVPIDDPDFDGIDSSTEMKVYKTDPRKADTDGDGFSDYQEITTGHDPLKK